MLKLHPTCGLPGNVLSSWKASTFTFGHIARAWKPLLSSPTSPLLSPFSLFLSSFLFPYLPLLFTTPHSSLLLFSPPCYSFYFHFLPSLLLSVLSSLLPSPLLPSPLLSCLLSFSSPLFLSYPLLLPLSPSCLIPFSLTTLFPLFISSPSPPHFSRFPWEGIQIVFKVPGGQTLHYYGWGLQNCTWQFLEAFMMVNPRASAYGGCALAI